LIAKELPAQRHRGAEENGKRWETEDTFILSSFSFLCLRASVVDSPRQSGDSTMIICQIPQPKKPEYAESKELTRTAFLPPDERRATFSGFVGQPKGVVGNVLIRLCLMADLMRRAGEGLLNLKDLLTVFPSSGRGTASRFVGLVKRGEGDLLISQGLMASLRRRTGEGLLNLKDLLTAFPPSLKRLFEDEPVLRPLFSCRIAPHSAIFQQKRADNGRNSNSLVTELRVFSWEFRAIVNR